MQLEKKIFSGKFSDPNKMAKWTKPKQISRHIPQSRCTFSSYHMLHFPNKSIKLHMGKIEGKRVHK